MNSKLALYGLVAALVLGLGYGYGEYRVARSALRDAQEATVEAHRAASLARKADVATSTKRAKEGTATQAAATKATIQGVKDGESPVAGTERISPEWVREFNQLIEEGNRD